ncbi:hypothetical protein PALB_120 [Pseudoalteromonas luteoviolacea B = ATCC 29581]|nr:hypothetical protein PALB_120 [Pseudoalteromonas luteoviolacea B = ATCC 29581]
MFIANAYQIFKRAKHYYLTTVLTLSLTFAMVLSAFSLVDLVFFSSLPYKNSDNLYVLEGTVNSKGFSGPATNAKVTSYIEKNNDVFNEFATYHQWSEYKLYEKPSRPDINVLLSSHNLFDVLGIKPFKGRLFNEQEALGNQQLSVVLGYRAWKTYFGQDAQIIGKKIQLNQRRFNVIGVLPDDLVLPFYSDINDAIWLPIDSDETFNPKTADGFMGSYKAVVRLKPSINESQITEPLNHLALEGTKLHAPNVLKDFSVEAKITSFQTALQGDSGGIVIMILVGVSLLMSIAMINLSSVQLAKAVTKIKPTAISFAFGASKKQLAVESFKHNVVVIGLAVFIALCITQSSFSLIKELAADSIQRLDTLGLSVNSLLFSIALTVIIASFYTYIELSIVKEDSLVDSLSSSGKGTGKQMSSGTSHLLVGLQILFSFIVLSAASHVVLVALSEAMRGNGINTENKVSLSINFSNIDTIEERKNIHRAIVQQLSSAPHVTHVATSSEQRLPDTMNVNQVYNASGRYIAQARNSYINRDYFSALDLKVEGKTFTSGDEKLAEPPIIINRRLAELLGKSPINQKISFDNKTFSTIIGIVDNMYVPGSPENEYYEVFTPGDNEGWRHFTYLLSLDADINLENELIDLINKIDSRLDISKLITLEEQFNKKRQRHLNAAWLAMVLSATSLFMVMIGINGIVSYIIKVRRYTLGVKLAMGADTLTLLKESILDLFKPIIMSLILSFSILFFTLGYAIAEFNLNAPILWHLIAVIWVALLAIAQLTAFFPVRKTLQQDPIKALRNE